MRRGIFAISFALVAALGLCNLAQGQGTVVVAVPAQAGAVQGTTQNSDAFIWQLFTQFAAPVSNKSPRPVLFETWASDEETFSTNPHWPTPGRPLKLHPSALNAAKIHGLAVPLKQLRSFTLDVPCNPPTGAAVGGFPTTGTPTPCIAEQVARNRPDFDYIVSNNLNTQKGLASAYAKSFQVDFPTAAIAIKGDWVPLPALLQWIPQLGSLDNIRKLYFTTTSNSVEYALLSMHVSSRQNPDWVWGTLEHQMNPGRCDYIGCFDTFGAQIPAVQPNRTAYNTQYGTCLKTPQLQSLMSSANLSPVWANYCLKSTEVDFTASDGTPYVLGNSVIEGIVGNGTIAASSCISCHYYASFGATGKPTAGAFAVLPFNPTGNPIPGVLNGARQFSFTWGVLQAP
ncbi:MAG TPA: hypothetical protein VNW97_04070 [Candidatus Saccharimonadales bacterium]|jgi:hypothetical protein|nr:hypothetical protein [Candidatus Saccharimonadales bacterium]